MKLRRAIAFVISLCVAVIVPTRSMGFKKPMPNTIGFVLLRGLADRVWLTEFNNGEPVYFPGIFDFYKFCRGNVSALDGSQADFPFVMKGEKQDKSFLIWPYKCHPTRLVYDHIRRDTVEESHIFIKMLDFPNVDKVLPSVFEIIKSNKLGKYKLSNEQKLKITELQKLNYRYTPSNVTRGLEKRSWLDGPELQNGHIDEYDRYVKNRLQMLSWDGVLHSRENGYVVYKINVPRNYFKPE